MIDNLLSLKDRLSRIQWPNDTTTISLAIDIEGDFRYCLDSIRSVRDDETNQVEVILKIKRREA
jgi:hypothetical protein